MLLTLTQAHKCLVRNFCVRMRTYTHIYSVVLPQLDDDDMMILTTEA